jgi:hypothetical protein
MFKYLEKILGKSSSYYEMLMKSRKENNEITALQINTIAKALEQIALPCSYFQSQEVINNFTIDNSPKWPLDRKLKPLPFIGEFEINNLILQLFVQVDKAVKDDKSQYLNVFKSSDGHKSIFHLNRMETSYTDNSFQKTEGKNTPIWEEIVHRFPALNNEIKAIAPKNPWTLYKSAKALLKSQDYDLQLGGFPQWLINDVDFRKIKKLEFLLEFKLQKLVSLYYFYDHDMNEVVMIKQKL